MLLEACLPSRSTQKQTLCSEAERFSCTVNAVNQEGNPRKSTGNTETVHSLLWRQEKAKGAWASLQPSTLQRCDCATHALHSLCRVVPFHCATESVLLGAESLVKEKDS